MHSRNHRTMEKNEMTCSKCPSDHMNDYGEIEICGCECHK